MSLRGDTERKETGAHQSHGVAFLRLTAGHGELNLRGDTVRTEIDAHQSYFVAFLRLTAVNRFNEDTVRVEAGAHSKSYEVAFSLRLTT